MYLGINNAGRRRQSVEKYTVSRNHAPVNVGLATLVASMFGAWVLLSPGETGAWNAAGQAGLLSANSTET